MSGKKAITGPGRFQWNTWGWFGGQVGSTLWLFALGLVWLFRGRVWTGVVCAILALVPNIIGLRLWLFRDRIRPHRALQILMGTIWFSVLGGILVLARAEGLSFGRIPLQVWSAALFFPFWMLVFYWIERCAVKSRKSGGAKGESGPR